MKNLKAYWAEVRKVEASLKESHPGGVHIVTLAGDNGLQPGLVKLALPYVAAQCLVNRTHEIATDAQVSEHNARMQTEARHVEAKRRWAGNMPDVFVVSAGGSK